MINLNQFSRSYYGQQPLDIRYLHRYGEYVGPNELGTAGILIHVTEEIDRLYCTLKDTDLACKQP